ncbi:6325_t:CDS:10 [Diversispora eburnea]|uniref:6325_t:CDS:1 n=3 Tax=Diversisporales TaxID=214509 RepID=A0A9N9AEX8_9GLOM|nr:6325_t:CDS:10 [Diversispora eburnea]
MLPQQTCSGKSNGNIQSFHISYWEKTCYLVEEHIQTIGISEFLSKDESCESLGNKINSVEMSENDGKIAITIGINVLVFYPQVNKEMTVQWNLMKILKHDYPVFCTSWAAGPLLVGGESLTLWENISPNYDMMKCTKIWEQKVSSKLILVQFSPDSTLFATMGECDRLLKIWWNSSNNESKERKYNFNYLPHPRAVTNFTWRKGPLEQKNSTGSNIILTMCKDGVCRIWTATNPEEPYNLYISTVVDPSQSLVTLQSSEEEEICSQDPDCFTPIHWIHPKEFLTSLRISMEAFNGDENDKAIVIGSGLRKLSNLANDTPDLLYQIQRDGSMVIWGILLVLLRIAQAIPISEVEYFFGNMATFYDNNTDNTTTDYLKSSVELMIVAQSPHGHINKYSIRLVDVFDNLQSTTSLQLKYSWTGHHSNIKSIIKAPGGNNFISLAKDGETILWNILTPELRHDKLIGPSIIEKSSVFMNSRIKYTCVFLNAAYDGTQIAIFSYENNNYSRQIAVLEDYDPFFELTLLFSFQNKIENLLTTFIAGVSSQKNMIFLWNIMENERGFSPQINFISRSSLPMMNEKKNNDEIIMAIAVEQWAGINARNYPSSDFNHPVLLTFSSNDGYIRYWQCIITNKKIKSFTKIWMEEVKFYIGEEIPKLIKCGPQGKVARLPPAKDFITTFSEEIIDIDWLFTSNAELVLAVSTSRKILIYTQLRKHYVSKGAKWILFSEISMPDNVPLSISGVSWGNEGSLIVASGNQLRCYSKRLSDESANKVSQITGINKSFPTLFHVVDHLNGPLPHHHPTLLLQHILWGKMDLVKQILVHLYRCLKVLINYDKPVLKILPLPFDKLLEDEASTISTNSTRYSLLFGEESDDERSHETVLNFTEDVADFLSEQLKIISLPDLSPVEQAQLLALIDTIIQVEGQKRSLDENGVRYVLFMRRFHYLNRVTLPTTLRSPGLSYRDMNWALHSDSQDLLIEYSMAASGGKFLWKDARVHGIFLWIRSNEIVRQQMEILARNHYMSKDERDPTDCSLFYMALRKRKLLSGLWKTANHHKEQSIMLKFLANDFNEPRWKTCALKNAYALLGKQRFEYAAAFFLLGDRLKDAVNVCLKHLNDFQLAVAICRVYEGDDGIILKSVFEEYIIPLAISTGDRWLASLAFWFLGQRDRAVKAIMAPLETLRTLSNNSSSTQSSTSISSPSSLIPTESPDAALIVLYKQLKEKSIQTLRGASEISPETEYFFVLRSIFAYDRMGCPLLALHLVRTWKFTPESMIKNPRHILKSRRRTTVFDIPILNNDSRISSGFINFDNWNIIWGKRDNEKGEYHENGNMENTSLLDDIYFNDYKVALIKRLLQQFLDAITIISEDKELFENSSYFSDYINRIEHGLKI